MSPPAAGFRFFFLACYQINAGECMHKMYALAVAILAGMLGLAHAEPLGEAFALHIPLPLEEHQRVAPPFADDESFVEQARQDVLIQLKDPSSAQFRGLWLRHMENGHVAVCGEINSKNSYGGYVGFMPFWWVAGGKASILSVSPDSLERLMFNSLYPRFCHQ